MYCTALKNESLVDSCEDFSAGFELEETRLYNHYQKREIDFAACVDDCLKDRKCVAITILGTLCHFYSGNNVGGYSGTKDSRGWKSVIFQRKIQSANINLTLQNSHIPKGTRGSNSNQTACEQSCIGEPQCDAYEYCDRNHQGSWCRETTNNCYHFSMKDITRLKAETYSFVKFIVRKVKK